jgi:urea transport system permease protein
MPDASTQPPPPAGQPDAPSPDPSSVSRFERSQTFLARSPLPQVLILRRLTVILLGVVFLILVPLLNMAGVIPDFRINVLGRYLSFAIVALGIDLIWGYTGILSLCQATFFCVGAYIMSMHLSLPQGGGDVRPEYNNIPQFMFFNNVHALPGFWKPFESMAFTLLAGITLSALLAACFGFFIFRSRVRGVYFAIVTQAVAWGAWLLISRNELLLGGTNGLTNFYKPLTESHRWILTLYLATLAVLAAGLVGSGAIVRSRLGRVLVAVRDKESRLYFAGYRPYTFKVFAFACAAVLAALGGMLYAPQIGIVTPQNMNTQASIDMVIWVALGGRGKLWGAIFGTLLVNYCQNAITSDLPQLWPFVEGAMFLGVVLLVPDGIVGIWNGIERRINSKGSFLDGVPSLAAIGALALFVLGQSLSLMPHWAESTFYTSERVGNLKWKYILLVAAMVACSIWQRVIDRPPRLAGAKSAAAEPASTGAH